MSEIDHIVLMVPARGEYARTARLAAGELASRLGMSVDQIDDVKLAAEETFVLACAYPGLESVTFDFELEESGLTLEVGPLPGAGPQGGPGEAGERYARFILEAVCDTYEMVEREGGYFVRLTKRVA